VLCEARQDPGDAPRKHGLPGTGWADHHKVVPPRGGHFERTPRTELASHVLEVGRPDPHRRSWTLWSAKRSGPRQRLVELADGTHDSRLDPRLVRDPALSFLGGAEALPSPGARRP
jgi:hypothetical protein